MSLDSVQTAEALEFRPETFSTMTTESKSSDPPMLTGVDMVLRWHGRACDLVALLSDTGLCDLFKLTRVAQGGIAVWELDRDNRPLLGSDFGTLSAWQVSFKLTEGALQQKAPPVSALLKVLESKVDWVHVEKNYAHSHQSENPSGFQSGDWTAKPLTGSLERELAA